MEIYCILRKARQSPHSFIAFAGTNSMELIQFLVKCGFEARDFPKWSTIESICKDNNYYDLEREIDYMKFRIQYISGVSTFVSYTSGIVNFR